MGSTRGASDANGVGDANGGASTFVCKDGTRLPVSVRVSTRAKRWRLQLSHTGDLEVVIPLTGRSKVPCAVPDAEVTAFLESHRAWIERAARRTKPQREAYEGSRAAGLPTHLDFPLANELWLVEYRPTQAKNITIKPDGLRRIQGAKQIYALKLSGATTDEDFCRRALVRFATRRAKEVIPPFAWEVCAEIGARPASVTVNNRKSAWGVCTHAGDIRIDRRVLFLPQDLARQIVLHEAAHLKHLNHSDRFYAELFSYEGSTREAERAVKKAIQLIPAWFIDGA
ncbi:MAG: M48 family metallopeptidase [Coriobacteriales bacterium]|jgi:predicted metal-dependent hydrolase|nr:M48 family metallopeptidase [Coriobacteriales bacterium]